MVLIQRDFFKNVYSLFLVSTLLGTLVHLGLMQLFIQTSCDSRAKHKIIQIQIKANIRMGGKCEQSDPVLIEVFQKLLGSWEFHMQQSVEFTQNNVKKEK